MPAFTGEHQKWAATATLEYDYPPSPAPYPQAEPEPQSTGQKDPDDPTASRPHKSHEQHEEATLKAEIPLTTHPNIAENLVLFKATRKITDL